jgi:hypothetical protein
MLGGSLGSPAKESEGPALDVDDPSAGDGVDPEQMTLEAGAADFIAASQSGDAGGVARAFRTMFDALKTPE